MASFILSKVIVYIIVQNQKEKVNSNKRHHFTKLESEGIYGIVASALAYPAASKPLNTGSPV